MEALNRQTSCYPMITALLPEVAAKKLPHKHEDVPLIPKPSIDKIPTFSSLSNSSSPPLTKPETKI
jgi:hypothetical protein